MDLRMDCRRAERNCGLRCVVWIAGGTVNIGRECGVRRTVGEIFWADRRGGERASTNWDWGRNVLVSRPVPLESVDEDRVFVEWIPIFDRGECN